MAGLSTGRMAVGVSGVTATGMLTDVIVHFQGCDVSTGTSEAGLLVLAGGAAAHIAWKLLTHWWPWLNGAAEPAPPAPLPGGPLPPAGFQPQAGAP